ncbi:MAG: 16S rRNA (guanine(527)-N(7))-methyltransferase RsmG [Bacteroidales bacterium]|nr:16S rRNA (guanine(527)-N(7))-methyltransferase RsmG [Bacteroidales bacterium]MBN2698204.1 16S rRNA (guanine(527)-N(7))-methyltransferase RsmG [Bacteroidales bacterium]
MDLILKYFPEISQDQIDCFTRLKDLYSNWNKKINVISRNDIENLEERHILHSLAVARFIQFRPETQVLDLGTGGGFPGIPLAIYFPDSRFVLVDSTGKKIKVVEEIIRALSLKNTIARHSRAEYLSEQFDFILSRAVAPLKKIEKWTRKNILSGSLNDIPNGWICLKGGELEKEVEQIGEPVTVIPLSRWYEEPFFSTKKIVYIKK